MQIAYIAIGPNAWGKADTLDRAVANMRKNVSSANRKYGYMVYEAHPDSTVEEVFGGIEYPKGHEPKLVKDARPKKGGK